MTAPAGPAGPPDHTADVRITRFYGPRGSAVHMALAEGDPARPLPANGGLRVTRRRLTESAARGLSGRLAAEMLLKHRLHRTGFWGAKIVVDGVDVVGDDLLALVAEVLNSCEGTVYTGADMGVDAADMERLARLTPYVLNAVGSRAEPQAATAHGVLGAITAWAGGSPQGLRVLVHGAGKVGGALARELVAAGATVLTCDRDAAAADIPGCRPVLDWAAHSVDVLAPCSVSDLLGPPAAERLRCGAVIGSANAVLSDERATAAVLARRGITFLPTALTNAGAVIVDSVEHYSPHAFRAAAPEDLYAFVRTTVHAAAVAHLGAVASPPGAPAGLPPTAGQFCGLRFTAGGATAAGTAGPRLGGTAERGPGAGSGRAEADTPAA